ncbi:hypothetical protein LSAT2_007003 [Lamellibrachia satsuma]|nr:hypothetical protein LSAT2_007003 [Lamellibrachia satsuma]
MISNFSLKCRLEERVDSYLEEEGDQECEVHCEVSMPKEKGNNEDFKSWLCESVLALCRGGLSYREDFSIEGVLGITIDHSDVFLVRIHNQDTVSVMKSEKAVQVSLEDHRTTYLQTDRASLHVESNGLSASDSDTPPSDSDTPPQEQIAVISLPLVRTLHQRHRPDAIPLHTGHNQLSSDGGDFQWHTSEPLLLASRDENPETKAGTRAQIESDLESSMPCKKLSATNLIPSVDVSDNTSDGQSTQPSFDAVNVDMNSSEISLTKIKQELNNDSWNEQSGCDGYAPGDTFRNYTMPQGAWDFSSSHTLLKVTDSSQQVQKSL